MIQAGLMAEEYGCTPAEIMHATDMHPMDQFQFNADVFTATSLYKQRVREEHEDRHDPNSAGVATDREKEELVSQQEARAQERAAGQTPGADQQLAALEEARDRRTDVSDDTHVDVPDDSGRDGMHDLGDVMGGDGRGE